MDKLLHVIDLTVHKGCWRYLEHIVKHISEGNDIKFLVPWYKILGSLNITDWSQMGQCIGTNHMSKFYSAFGEWRISSNMPLHWSLEVQVLKLLNAMRMWRISKNFLFRHKLYSNSFHGYWTHARHVWVNVKTVQRWQISPQDVEGKDYAIYLAFSIEYV